MGKKKNWDYPSDVDRRIDEIKMNLCSKLQIVMMRQQRNDLFYARMLRTSRSNISAVQNSRIKRLSISQLVLYLARLTPRFEILISV